MTSEAATTIRYRVYLLLAALALGAVVGRVMAVDSVDRRALQETRLRQIPAEVEKYRAQLARKGVAVEEIEKAVARYQERLYQRAILCRPFLSANDRSRWATVRALVEPDMRVPGAPYAIDRVIQEPLWDTIDMVKHSGHLYSSKPPFLATIMAALYWPLYHWLGLSLGENPYLVGRVLLVVFNGGLLGLLFWLLSRLVEEWSNDDLARVFTFAAGCFGTFLTTFAVTFNNHLPGAVAAAATIYLICRIYCQQSTRWTTYALCGLTGGLVAACEMPALSLSAVAAFLVLLPPGLAEQVLGRAAEGVNNERSVEGPDSHPEPLRADFLRRLRLFTTGFLPAFLLVAVFYFGTNWIAHGTLRPPYMHRSATDPARNWYIFTYERQGRIIQSYWTNPIGIDRGEPNPWVYAFHVLVGHHGIFSLTPMWILALCGFVVGLIRAPDPRMRTVLMFMLLISIVCIGFYLARPQMDRNYGGMTSAFRWAFWLAPLWLVAMLPAVERLARSRWGWVACAVLVGLSAMSANYPTWNPWVHPWIYEWMYHLGWITG